MQDCASGSRGQSCGTAQSRSICDWLKPRVLLDLNGLGGQWPLDYANSVITIFPAVRYVPSAELFLLTHLPGRVSNGRTVFWGPGLLETFDQNVTPGVSVWIEALGYVAAVLVIATYAMRTMIPLRVTSICASILFVLYGYFAPSNPQLVLHGILLPLNAIRLHQMKKLIHEVKRSSDGDLSMDWLHPFSSSRSSRAGEVLFRKGEPADMMYYTVSGRYVLVELDIEIGSGEVVGEIGLVEPQNLRTQTFKCLEAGELLTISYERVKEIYFQNPQFGFYFLNLIAKRLIANNETLARELEKRSKPSRRRKKS